MSAVYWVTFRIAERSNSGARYQALMDSLREITKGPWWVESTSFVLFRSDLDIDDVALTVAACIDSTMDLALVGMPDFKSARAIGHTTDPDLFELMPFTKKL